MHKGGFADVSITDDQDFQQVLRHRSPPSDDNTSRRLKVHVRNAIYKTKLYYHLLYWGLSVHLLTPPLQPLSLKAPC